MLKPYRKITKSPVQSQGEKNFSDFKSDPSYCALCPSVLTGDPCMFGSHLQQGQLREFLLFRIFFFISQ